MVCLVVFRFFFFFISVLGEVVTMGEEGPAVAVPRVELPPVEALTNFPPWLGRIGLVAGL